MALSDLKDTSPFAVALVGAMACASHTQHGAVYTPDDIMPPAEMGVVNNNPFVLQATAGTRGSLCMNESMVEEPEYRVTSEVEVATHIGPVGAGVVFEGWKVDTHLPDAMLTPHAELGEFSRVEGKFAVVGPDSSIYNLIANLIDEETLNPGNKTRLEVTAQVREDSRNEGMEVPLGVAFTQEVSQGITDYGHVGIEAELRTSPEILQGNFVPEDAAVTAFHNLTFGRPGDTGFMTIRVEAGVGAEWEESAPLFEPVPNVVTGISLTIGGKTPDHGHIR